MTAAAAPQVGGQAWSRVSGPYRRGEASTSSTDTSVRKIALSLCTAWRRALTVTLAKVSGRTP